MKKLVVCLLAVTMVLCMSFAVVSVSAAESDFSPSVEAKPVPTIVVTNGNGAVINNGNATEGVPAEDIFCVSYQAAYDKITAGTAGDNLDACRTLIGAYDALKIEGVKNKIEGIDEFAKASLAFSNPEYFVSHVFELNIGSKTSKLEGDATVTIKFANADINAEKDALIVACMVGNKWVIVPANCVVVTDNSVEVTFDELCPVALIHVEEGESQGEVTTTPEEETDDDFNGVFGFNFGCKSSIGMGAIVVVSVIGAALVFKKKDN